MNLQKLFEAQAELDAYIEQQHPKVDNENRLEKKVLALLVELGECANEWRGFKFWSNNQNPKTKVEYSCVQCEGDGVTTYWTDEGQNNEKCIDCNGTGKIGESNPLLEEYVDCLHFILSIGNDMYFSQYYNNEYDMSLNKSTATADCFTNIFIMASEINSFTCYDETLDAFLDLGNSLGFSAKQIEEAYWKKYEINKQRQKNGY